MVSSIFFPESVSFPVSWIRASHHCFQDPSSWGDFSSFEFSEEADTSSPSRTPSGRAPHLTQREANVFGPEGHPLSNLSKKTMQSQDSLALPKSLTTSKAPWVILHTKRGHPNHLACGPNKSFILADVSNSTPKCSPVKSLPFSPSQVEQDFCTDVTNS